MQSVWKTVRLTQVCIIFACNMYNCNYFGINSHLCAAASWHWSAQWRISSARTVSIPVDLWGHARDVMLYSLVDSCHCFGWSCHVSRQGRINISFILLPWRWGWHVLPRCLHLSMGLLRHHILKCELHVWPGMLQVRELGSVVTWVWFVTVLKLKPATDHFVQVWSDLPLVCEFLLRCSSRSSDAHFRHPCDRQDVNIPAGTSGLLHVYSNWHLRAVRNCKYSLTG